MYAFGFATNDHVQDIPFRYEKVQRYMVQLMDLVNNISYRLHTTWTWTTAKLDNLESDLAKMLADWHGMNELANEFGSEKDLVSWTAKEKVGSLNAIRRCIETLGRIRDNTSALGEKAHQLMKHCREISKGANKKVNSLKQAQRGEYYQLRELHRQRQRKEAAARDAEEAAAQGAPVAIVAIKAGVELRGLRTFGQALPNLPDKVVARINHLIREAVKKESRAVDAAPGQQRDYVTICGLLPTQPSTPTGAYIPYLQVACYIYTTYKTMRPAGRICSTYMTRAHVTDCDHTITGHKASRRLLQACKAVTYHASATLYRDGKKQYAVLPRRYEAVGSGVRVHVESDGNPFSRAELTALLQFVPPETTRTYEIAIVHLLKKVPKMQCVVMTAQAAGSFFEIGDLVNIADGWTPGSPPRDVPVKKCGGNQRASIHTDDLRLITESEPGAHAVMHYCGDYMQYGKEAKVDCSSAGYSILDEYEAVSIRTGIKMQVVLVPDVGGMDSLERRRFFWNDRLYSH